MRLFGFCSEKSHKSIMEVSFLAALSFLYQILHSIGETLVVQLRHVSQFSSESHQAVYFQRRTNLLFRKSKISAAVMYSPSFSSSAGSK